jgi:hypothetical protein
LKWNNFLWIFLIFLLIYFCKKKKFFWSRSWVYELTRINLSRFIVFFFRLKFFPFHLSTMNLLIIELNIFFRFFLYGLSWSYNPDHRFRKVNSRWPESIQHVVISIYFKKYIVLNFFQSNYVFNSCLDCLWTRRINQVISCQLSHDLIFLLEKY